MNFINDNFISPNPYQPALNMNLMTNGNSDLMDPTNARQLWLGNLQQEVTTEDLCNVIRGGLVVNIKLMIEKHCAFVTFADPKAAIDFFNHANSSNVVVKNRRIKVGWGKPTPLSERLQDALQKGATRNIYLGGIDAEVSEDKLRQDFSEFGEIEQIHIIRNKNTGFVNFTTLLNAVSAYERIQRNEAYSGCTIRYGKDRCNNAIRTNSRNGFNNYNMTSDQNGMGYNNSPIHTPYGNTTPLNMANPHLSNGTF